MTALQMRLAVSEIYKGKTFNDSLIPKTEKNRLAWNELLEEIKYGFSIDKQEVKICFTNQNRIK